MEDEFITRIEAAEIPSDLKAALANYFQVFASLEPHLPGHLKPRLRSWMGQLLAEAAGPALETHWWESLLVLIPRELQPVGERVQPLMAAGEQLASRLAEYLGPYTGVSLRAITTDTVVPVCRLSDTLVEPQSQMVAPNAYSLAQALFNPKAWYRAIYAGKQLVGFIMLYDDQEEPNYFLWRFMISRPCQGRGYGAQAVEQLVEYVKTRPNARELKVSVELGPGSPQPFYLKQGFVSTGEFFQGELVLKKQLV